MDSASLIKRIVVGSLISEYALRELQGHQDLKYRSGIAIRACEKVQSYLLNHPDISPEMREVFKSQFLKDNAVLIGELIELVWDFVDGDLEDLINKIKENVQTVD